MAETTPLALAVALDVSLAMPLMDTLKTAVGGVNRLADAAERSDRHVFAGCVAFSTGARVLDRAELSVLDWDYEYMTDLGAGIELAANLLDEHPNRRLVLITTLDFHIPRFTEPSGYPEASQEHLTGWAERARVWRDDREDEELGRAMDALAAVVRRGAVVDVMVCQGDDRVRCARHVDRLGELAITSGGVVGLLTPDDGSSFAALSAAIGLPA
jgi:uncharacterized protein with von Willebrand factor type A (vWA) domain